MNWVRRAAWATAAVMLVGLGAAATGCGADTSSGARLRVVATTSVLADVVRNVAGARADVHALIPAGTDPHAFEARPSDLRAVVSADLVVVNGGGLEGTLLDTLADVGGDVPVVAAARGIATRTPKSGEPGHEHAADAPVTQDGDELSDGDAPAHSDGAEVDPHYWLDPVLVEQYVATVCDALTQADPQGASFYEANAAEYIERLRGLDAWIREQVTSVPPEHRKLVTNHASHGYWADRYGFRVVGAVIPSVSTGASATARELADLIATIRRERVPAIFVQVQDNPRLAQQLAADTDVTVVTDLYTHSLTGAEGPAPTYIDMMKHDTEVIVEALR